MPRMTADTMIKIFLLFSVFVIGSHAQSLLQVLRQEGFTEWAGVLESTRGAKILNYPGNLIVYAPTNAGLLRQQLSGDALRKRLDFGDLWPEYGAIPWSGNFGSYKRSGSTCSQDLSGPGAVDLMTLLNDPEFVNLPDGQNASIVQKNMPKGTLPIVLTGLGDSVRVVGRDIPFDKGIIRPISGWFTLPQSLSTTLPYIGANRVLDVLERSGLTAEFDNRTGITFLAPDDQSIPADISDDALVEILRRHVIVGVPTFTSDINFGDSFQTLAGTTVEVTIQCGEVFIDGARILSGDAIVKNGVVHVVDKLLEAPKLATTTLFQTVTITATETTKVIETTVETTTETKLQVKDKVLTTTETVEVPVADATTTTETVTTHVGEATQTVEIRVPDITTTETVVVNEQGTQTVHVPVPNTSTTTTTETVTVNIPQTPETTLSLHLPPPPPPSSVEAPPPHSSSVNVPPPPPPISSTSLPPPPPLSSASTLTTSPPPVTSTTSNTPPPPISSSEVSFPPPPSSTSQTPVLSSSTSSTPPPSSSTSEPPSSTSSSVSTPPPSSSSLVYSPPPSSSSVSTPPPLSSSSTISSSTTESTPCPESSTTSSITSSSIYVPSSISTIESTPCPESSSASSTPPPYPSYPVFTPSESSSEIPPSSSSAPPAYSSYPVYEPSSLTEPPVEPSSTPCAESSSLPPAYPTTLVTSQKPSSVSLPPSPSVSEKPPHASKSPCLKRTGCH